jgi:segregation and condensation protein B
MEIKELKHTIEAALLAFDEPLATKDLLQLFPDQEITANDINQALNELEADYKGRAIELKRLSRGHRLQTKASVQPWLQNLQQQKPKKLSRALLETLALIAYRQPITRGEIEDIRGVAVSSKIIHFMMDQDWIRVLGYRDVPGKPAMLGTTKGFLDHFNLNSLQDLPSLAEIKDIETLEQELEFPDDNKAPDEASAEQEQAQETDTDES